MRGARPRRSWGSRPAPRSATGCAADPWRTPPVPCRTAAIRRRSRAYGRAQARFGAGRRCRSATRSTGRETDGDRGGATVAPGPVHTRPEARDLFDALAETTAMKRASDPTEIAEVVAFLVSPKAGYTTGATIAVDGGRTAI
ncbi:SDR family oxidoreductase [Streptomyces sp. NPDC048506]|uniref:SDR family oxidoreductase n=1 Tax=Streptomyces sp. NPDC048506 TaxID=3155028 RepID=UPI00343E578B